MCCPIGRPWGTVVVESHHLIGRLSDTPGTLVSIDITEDGQCWALFEVGCTATYAAKIELCAYKALARWSVMSSERIDGSMVPTEMTEVQKENREMFRRLNEIDTQR